jgi:hypothetical protein
MQTRKSARLQAKEGEVDSSNVENSQRYSSTPRATLASSPPATPSGR